MKADDQTSLQTGTPTVRQIYDRYSAMLLGYISELVADGEQAEQYLISVFSELPNHLNEITQDGVNTWCHLQRLAKSKILFNEKLNNARSKNLSNIGYVSNKYFEMMSENQKFVFSGIYYQGKTINLLSQELNTTIDSIRKTLKEAFHIIKQTA